MLTCNAIFVGYINMLDSHGIPETTWISRFNDNSRTLQAAVSNSQEGGDRIHTTKAMYVKNALRSASTQAN